MTLRMTHQKKYWHFLQRSSDCNNEKLGNISILWIHLEAFLYHWFSHWVVLVFNFSLSNLLPRFLSNNQNKKLQVRRDFRPRRRPTLTNWRQLFRKWRRRMWSWRPRLTFWKEWRAIKITRIRRLVGRLRRRRQGRSVMTAWYCKPWPWIRLQAHLHHDVEAEPGPGIITEPHSGAKIATISIFHFVPIAWNVVRKGTKLKSVR